jgi:hypothetical protein
MELFLLRDRKVHISSYIYFISNINFVQSQRTMPYFHFLMKEGELWYHSGVSVNTCVPFSLLEQLTDVQETWHRYAMDATQPSYYLLSHNIQ